MTEDALRVMLFTLPSLQAWPEPLDDLLVALQDLAEQHPRDRQVAEVVRYAHLLASAGRGLPSEVGGIRRLRLVRADATTTTWDGRHLQSGKDFRLRLLRPEYMNDPVVRRILLRDARALEGIVEGVSVSQDWPGLVAPLPGPPLVRGEEGPEVPLLLLARVLGSALEAAARWERAGMGPPPLTTEDLRDSPSGVSLVALTPASPGGQNLVRAIAHRVQTWAGYVPSTAMSDLMNALVEMPHGSIDVALEAFRKALVSALAQQRHEVVSRRQMLQQSSREARLLEACRRLLAACPAPRGRGAVGVDLEGSVTLVEGRTSGLYWGPVDDLQPIWTPEEGFDAPHARRLLRGRAVAPPNPRLNAEVAGDPDFTDHACRWVSTALRIRTIGLLLDTSPNQPWEIAS